MMNIIRELTQQSPNETIMNKIVQQTLKIFKDNEISVAEARVICENLLTTMENSPLK